MGGHTCPRVCTSGKAAGGRERKQATTHGGPLFLWFRQLRSTEHRTYSVPDGRSRLGKRRRTGQPTTPGQAIYTDHASRGARGERGKKKDDAASRKVSPAPWWLFCTTHTTAARCTAVGEGMRSQGSFPKRQSSRRPSLESRLQHCWHLGPPTVLLSGPTGSSGPAPLASRAACTRCGPRSSRPAEAEGEPPAVGEEAPPEASSTGQPTAGGLVASGLAAGGPAAGGPAVGSPVERRPEVARHPVVRTRGLRGAVVLSRTFRLEAASYRAEAWPAAFPEVEWRTRMVA